LRLVEEHLKQKEHKKGVIIDGFPRSLWQAKNFSFPIDKVVYLKVSDKVNKERLLKRGRGDDKPELIDKRLKIYHQETEPILAYYRQQGLLLEIDGERPVEVIFKDIVAQLGEKND
jgi:adenylate kinase